ncbi:MAG: hypothetical protein CFE22_06310 [Cytophagaceae bacterium BCCC1]|nr:MAG: hypothetical protein CFE22_06310 [Cytophagaceae bacterium BCCC1]
MKTFELKKLVPVLVSVTLIAVGLFQNRNGDSSGNGYILGGGVPLLGFILHSLYQNFKKII